MISFQNVSKLYRGKGNHTALQNVNLQVGKGEFVFVVGPSGAGKSTFLRLVTREEVPSQGRVIVGGLDVGALRPRDIPHLRRNLGVVFQDFKLLLNKTVWENVAFTLQVTGVSRRDILRRVPAALEQVGLRQKQDAKPLQLSGGEQQRVAIARAIVSRPALLLADEPTGNLDPEAAKSVVRVLWEINRWGTTVVMATHAQGVVDSMRQRVVALEDGRVVRDQLQGAYGA